MGRNGMGKTTLMKSLMGIIPTRSGAVRVDGTDITGLKSYRAGGERASPTCRRAA